MTIVKNKHTDKYIPYFNGKYILLHEIMEFVTATVIPVKPITISATSTYMITMRDEGI